MVWAILPEQPMYRSKTMLKLTVSKAELAMLIGHARVHSKLRIKCYGDVVIVRGKTFAYKAKVVDTQLKGWDNL